MEAPRGIVAGASGQGGVQRHIGEAGSLLAHRRRAILKGEKK